MAPARRRKPFLSKKILAIIAIIVIIVGLGTYAYLASRPRPPPPSDFNVELAPGSEEFVLTKGVQQNMTVRVLSIQTFASQVQLNVTGLPTGVTAAFNPGNVTPPTGSVATSTLRLLADTTATVTPTSPLRGSVQGTSPEGVTRTTNFTFWILRKPVLSVQAPAAPVAPGTTFSVNVTVSKADNLFAFEFKMRFDPTIVKAKNVSLEGYFGTAQDQGLAFLLGPGGPPLIDNATGRLELVATLAAPTPPLSDEGPAPVITIFFVAEQAGVSTLDLFEEILLAGFTTECTECIPRLSPDVADSQVTIG